MKAPVHPAVDMLIVKEETTKAVAMEEERAKAVSTSDGGGHLPLSSLPQHVVSGSGRQMPLLRNPTVPLLHATGKGVKGERR